MLSSVVHNHVRPRLAEIRALAKRECRDLSPIVTTTSQNYLFPAKEVVNESHPFGENATILISLEPVDKNRQADRVGL